MKGARIVLASLSTCAVMWACASFDEGSGGGGGPEAGALDAPAGPGVDGSSGTDGSADDAAKPFDQCRTRPFSVPQKIMSNISAQASARVANDSFVYVSWDTSPDLAIAIAKRSGNTLTNQTGSMLNAVNTAADEFDPTVSPDGNVLVFGSIRADAGANQRLYMSLRPSTGSAWGLPVPISGGGDGVVPFQRPFFASAATLYYVEGAPARFRRATLETSLSALVGATDVAGPFVATDDHPVVTADELVMFFRRNGDIYTTTRTSIGEVFEPATAVAAVSSGVEDYPTWISANGCELFFVSLRSGTRELYVATRQ